MSRRYILTNQLEPHREAVRTAEKRQPDKRTKGIATFGDALERDLDASKESAWTSRERGRFGSHPAHDDYSDESEP